MKLKFIVAILMVLLGAVTLNANAARHARAAAESTAAASQPVNINIADVKTLMTIKGVGQKRAQAIIDYRTQNGPFKSVDDLEKVKGVGAKRLATLLKNNPNRIVTN